LVCLRLSIADYLLERKLHWLGYLGRMDESRTPKLLFGELLKRRPFHGTKKRDDEIGMMRLRDDEIGMMMRLADEIMRLV